MDNSYSFEDFFWIPNLVYITCGYDFIRSFAEDWKQRLISSYYTLVMVLHMYSKYNLHKQLYYLICDGEVSDIIRTGAFVAYGMDSNIKFFTFVFNQKRIRHLLHILKDIYPKTSVDRGAYRTSSHYWSKTVQLVIALFFLGDAFILLSPLLQSTYYYARSVRTNGNSADVSFAYMKPFPMPYDFNHTTPWTYFLAYIIDTGNGIFTGMSNIGTDLWIIAFVMQLNMHLEYIGHALEGYVPSVLNDKLDCDFLGELIRRHQTIYYVHEQLNGIFGISLIFTLVSTSCSICLINLILLTDGFTWLSAGFAPFVLSMVAQLYLVCYYGQQLLSLSQLVKVAAYNSRWYCGSKSYKKMILFVMLRSQKQAALSAKGFQTVSLNLFQMVLSMTYRIFAIVRTTIEK